MPERQSSQVNLTLGIVQDTPDRPQPLTSSNSAPDLGKASPRRKSKLYTRTGDRGSSALYNGARRPKNDEVFEALGAVEELTSMIGIACCYCEKSGNGLRDELQTIQRTLVEVATHVATPRSSSTDRQLQQKRFDESHVAVLEARIDDVDARTPPLKGFILPAGGESAVYLYHARSVCRRAERRAVSLSNEVDGAVVHYLNRLGDYLFACGRFAALHDGQADTPKVPES